MRRVSRVIFGRRWQSTTPNDQRSDWRLVISPLVLGSVVYIFEKKKDRDMYQKSEQWQRKTMLIERLYDMTKDKSVSILQAEGFMSKNVYPIDVEGAAKKLWHGQYVPKITSTGKVMIEPCDVAIALSARSPEDTACNPLHEITMQRSKRPRQLSHIERVFMDTTTLLAEFERRIQHYDVNGSIIPSDVRILVDAIAAKGRFENLRTKRPYLVAAVHEFLRRKGNDNLTIQFINRFHTDWMVEWTPAHCEAVVKEHAKRK
jgi:hypothetical protein